MSIRQRAAEPDGLRRKAALHFDISTFRRSDVSRSGRRGMALIDVIIGAMLLGVGLAVIISLSSRSLASQTEGEKTMTAAWLADELLTMVLVEGPDEYPHLYDMDGWFYEPFEEFFYRVDIEQNGFGMAYTVVATVGWEQWRSTREIQIEAAIAARGGDREQPREPRERVDREARHHERIFGADEESEQTQSKAPVLPPPSGGKGLSDESAPGGAKGGGGGGR